MLRKRYNRTLKLDLFKQRLNVPFEICKGITGSEENPDIIEDSGNTLSCGIY